MRTNSRRPNPDQVRDRDQDPRILLPESEQVLLKFLDTDDLYNIIHDLKHVRNVSLYVPPSEIDQLDINALFTFDSLIKALEMANDIEHEVEMKHLNKALKAAEKKVAEMTSQMEILRIQQYHEEILREAQDDDEPDKD